MIELRERDHVPAARGQRISREQPQPGTGVPLMTKPSVHHRSLMKIKAILLACITGGMFLATAAMARAPQGVWLIDGEAAVQIFDCEGLLCGRVLYLESPHDPQGELKRDKRNPDQALRDRELCGLSVIWDLRPSGTDNWEGGRFYNPDSGQTYDVKMKLTASDTLEARFYLGASFLGQTKTLNRIERGTSKGWC